MRRDPNNPQKWDAVDKNDEPPEASRFGKSAGFIVASFNSGAVPQSLYTCQSGRGGFFGYPCSQYAGCYRVEQLGDGAPGYSSDFPVPGYCKLNPETQTEVPLDRLRLTSRPPGPSQRAFSFYRHLATVGITGVGFELKNDCGVNKSVCGFAA